MKGSYVLLIKLEKDIDIKIGSLGSIYFKKGFYVYVGSALNGLEQRIKRHVRRDKKVYWHIDFFLKNGFIVDVFYIENNTRKECNIAKILNEKLKNIPYFGCSDCKCKSHFFYGEKSKILSIIDTLNMKKYKFKMIN